MQSKILVVGDIIIDEYLFGNSTRISPEAPVPIVAFERKSRRPGGAANVAANIGTMGGSSYLIGVCDEPYSRDYVDQGKVLKGYTNLKVRVMANGSQICRVDYDNGDHTQLIHHRELMQAIGDALQNLDIGMIVISDYNKGVIDSKIATWIIAVAQHQNIPVIVDTKKQDMFCFDGALLITPNAKESAEADWTNCDAFRLITMGEHGMTLWFNKDHFIEIEAEQVDVADVTGAGDVVLASMALGIMEFGHSVDGMEKAAFYANRAAALSVTRQGTCVVHRRELG